MKGKPKLGVTAPGGSEIKKKTGGPMRVHTDTGKCTRLSAKRKLTVQTRNSPRSCWGRTNNTEDSAKNTTAVKRKLRGTLERGLDGRSPLRVATNARIGELPEKQKG